MTTRSIGIDLGTTNSCVATIAANGQPQIIASRQGHRTLPSVVSFAADGRVAVGAPARRQAIVNPRETIFGVKRLIGRRWEDNEVQRFLKTLPYEVVPAPNGDAWVQLGGRFVSPQEVSAHVLAAMRTVAEEHFAQSGDTLGEAIITVPAYFDDAQRQATKDAAEIAGLRVRRLLNEPTAAALGYGAHRQPAARFAVCDLGGGTFDVSILNVEDGVFEVISTHGDIMLGGDDFDRRITERLGAELHAQLGLDPAADPQLLGRLREEAEKLKHALSEAAQATLQLPHLTRASGQPASFVRTVSRAELEAWLEDIVARLEAPCRECLSNAGLGTADVDRVILIGGSTRMPAVQRKLEQIFGKRPARDVNPDEAVAIGAATQCAILDGQLEGIVLLDVTSRALGIHAGRGRFAPVVPRNATIPTREHKILATQEDGQRELAIEIYEGESFDVRQNRHLGTFVLTGLPEAPAGEVLVMIDFTVDVDGILRVSARELSEGASLHVRLQATCGLTRTDVRRLAAARAAR